MGRERNNVAKGWKKKGRMEWDGKNGWSDGRIGGKNGKGGLNGWIKWVD